MTKTELVFIPAPAPGHLVSFLEFSKRLIARDADLSITILILQSPFNRKAQTPPTPNIRYITLPQEELPPQELFKESIEHTFSVYIASHVPHVKDTLTRLLNPVHVAGLFLDMFCTSMIDVAHQLDIPSYVFFCSSAGFLGFLDHLPVHSERTGETRFNESGPEEVVACFKNPVPTRVLPNFGFNSLGYKSFMAHVRRFAETRGVIVNTFAELEPLAIKSLLENYETAPVYTVGPVLDLDSQVHEQCDAAERDRIMRWLNKQPESSVAFLCFGSGGSFNDNQIREISKGLRQSGQKFLWSLRKPPTGKLIKPTEYTEIEMRGILGDDFWGLLEEGQQGLVCGWAPQVEILAHESVGAFVSHCGWNSTLESLWFGKPMVTWPMYAEQNMNAFELVKELGIAVELTLDYRLYSDSFVVASDVERAVRSVMDKDNPVRCRVKEMAEVSKGALMEGGSSFRCIDQLISNIVGGSGKARNTERAED